MRKLWLLGFIVLSGIVFSTFVRAEDLTLEQKVDQLLKQSERVQLWGYLQEQYYRDETDNLPNGTGNNGLFMRRGEIALKGKLMDRLSYGVSFDVSSADNLLREAFLEWAVSPSAEARFGQFRIPFGIEIQTSSRKLYFIDRMLVAYPNNEQPSSKAITSVKSGYLQERDLGLKLSGRLLPGTVGLDYSIGVFNGSDKNTPDRNDKKDFVGRVGLSPLKMLAVGGSAYIGKTPQSTTTGFTGLNVKRNRYGADLELRPTDPMIFRAEYIVGTDDAVKFAGYYAFVAYRLPMNIEPAVRFERLDPDKDRSDNDITRTTIGVNYYIKGDTKVQADYEFRDDKAAPKMGNMALVQLQFLF